MNQLKLFILAVSFFYLSIAFADGDDIYLNNLNYCNVSKIEINDYEPLEFESTNNLLRKTGQEEIYCGEKIIVHGRVLDQNCVPVSDATLYAWQVNCSGKYTYQPLKTLVDKKLIDLDNSTSFTGNGTATTNNKGEFYFITVYPPAMHDLTSHINVRVEHNRLGSLQTNLKLKGKKVNNPKDNPELNSISGVAADNGISIYDFEVLLPGAGLKSY
jgi:protocatechuate 3,4-dioxygenase beta subunit